MKKLASVLLVDDDPIANYVNKTLLQKTDVVDNILIANNGKVAFQFLEQQTKTDSNPNLILLDINMPVMNGMEFMQAYKNLKAEQKYAIKVVILTTSNHPRDLECFASLPITDFLNKPLTTTKITDLFEKHFAIEGET